MGTCFGSCKICRRKGRSKDTGGQVGPVPRRQTGAQVLGREEGEGRKAEGGGSQKGSR